MTRRIEFFSKATDEVLSEEAHFNFVVDSDGDVLDDCFGICEHIGWRVIETE